MKRLMDLLCFSLFFMYIQIDQNIVVEIIIKWSNDERAWERERERQCEKKEENILFLWK